MSVKNQVSGQVTESMLRAAAEPTWPFTVDLEAAGLADNPRVTSRSAWVSWEEYLQVLDAISGGSGSPEAYTRCGILSMEHEAHRSFGALGSLVGGLTPMYRAVFGWVMGMLQPDVQMSLTEVATGQLRVEIHVDPSLPPSAAYFYTVCGSMTALPLTLGRPHATVTVEVSDHAAVYEVTLPSRADVWSRVRRGWRSMTDQQAYDEAFLRVRDKVDLLIDDLREVNGQLVESRAKWERLATGIPGAVVVLGPHGEARGPFGAEVPTDAVLGAIARAAREPERWAAVLERGESVPFEVTGGVGQRAWAWACRASRLPGAGEVVIVALDDSERVRADHALREREQRLLQSQKMEALGRVAGGLAHDLNNLFAALVGHAELLGQHVGEQTEAQAHVEGILGVVDSASELTRQLLLYARNRPIRPEAVDLREAVTRHRSMFEHLLRDGVVLRTDVGDEALYVEVDPSQLQQVLMNLVVNARDAMPDGGEIGVATQVVRADGQDWVEVTVADEGVGMEEAVLQRAMEPFFTTKETGRGTGLGLSTVYWIVERAGGRVSFESKQGQGTMARVRLPRVRSPAVRERPSAQQVPRRRAATEATVLLVEDDAAVRTLTAHMLEHLGYRVVTAEDAQVGRRILAECSEPPQFLLTDITMPGESGLSLASGLAAERADLAIVLMSGFTAEAPELAGAQRGRSVFMHKPFSLEQLGAALTQALERAHSLP